MPKPRDVFEDPERYWGFVTSDDDAKFESQYFDRKEAGRVAPSGSVKLDKVRQHIKETISAFANTNKAGGLLVLGVSQKGEIKGLSHLTDDQQLNLMAFDDVLRNQSVQVKFVDCHNEAGSSDQIVLIYVPFSEHGICETPGKFPEAWLRQGSRNLSLNDHRREQLRRDKKITDFENAFCCPYVPDELDRGVLTAFRNELSHHPEFEMSDEQLLYTIGALTKDGDDYEFTNAGYLFFAANPQRVLSWGYIRLLRFECNSDDIENRGLPTLDKPFSGPITTQIRDVRTFLQESGFFKQYQKRDPQGGGIQEEPEFPLIAVDEAIVNAVAHRDYGMKLPIECEYYKDAFIVRNAGHIQQRDKDVPDHFSLEDVKLVSTPRNPKLIEWLKTIRDNQGATFVRALSEGTFRMHAAMRELDLPAPEYEVSQSQTTLTLYSNAAEREAAFQSVAKTESTEFSNLFPLEFLTESGNRIPSKYLDFEHRSFLATLKDVLKVNGWFVDRDKYSRLEAHRRGISIAVPEIAEFVRFYPGYIFQVRHYWEQYYLMLEYSLQVLNIKPLSYLLPILGLDDLVGRPSTAKISDEQGWLRGKITSVDGEIATIKLFDFDEKKQVPTSQVIPQVPISIIKRLLQQNDIKFDLGMAIKQHSLSKEWGASRTRFDKTVEIAEQLSRTVFPLMLGNMRVLLNSEPAPLLRHGRTSGSLRAFSLSEPQVEFSRHRETPDIRQGITQFGAYEHDTKDIALIPICTPALSESMVALIDRLKGGKYKYRGAERTFGVRFKYDSVIPVSSPEATLSQCQKLLKVHPDWFGDETLSRLFLIYTPEAGYALDDENAPYYKLKRFLGESGMPCQMVDTKTLEDPDWKDLNLALNIVTKCNITPWVLPDAIPDADFFVGLSYTQSRKQERQMGYANVFNEYGKWQFYSGNTEAFPYDKRVERFGELIRQTLERLSLHETPHIYFHYSAKFSRQERRAILEAARSVRPLGTYSFVWINTHTKIRLYDSRPETDGSFSRGSYVVASPNQIYLSTTGYNPYRKVFGTPQMLEITIRTEPPEGRPRPTPDLKSLAIQILSLTKLNWASTDSLCGEPITTKYAGDIAYLTAAFLRQSSSFTLHPVLETTPWFI